MDSDLYATSDTTTSTLSPAAGIGFGLFYIAIIVYLLVANWKMFQKTGRPGWYSLVPIYNTVVIFQIAGLNPWLIVLFFIPFVNFFAAIIIGVMLALRLAKSFGKSSTFGIVGLFIFSPVGLGILAFGDATYIGPNGVPAGAPAPDPLAPQAPVATPPSQPTPSI